MRARQMSNTSHHLDIQWACDDEFSLNESIQQWADLCLNSITVDASEISLRIVSADEMIALNSEYRGKNKITNVLSFPLDVRSENNRQLLGDIAICTDLVKTEAKEQEKPVEAHFAHLLVHGILHLSGYDHTDDKEAEVMENLERKILADIGFSDPYENKKL